MFQLAFEIRLIVQRLFLLNIYKVKKRDKKGCEEVSKGDES